VINKATLTVIANNDAKFVTKADNPGYAGASYTGFVGGEDASVLGGALNVTRSNAGVGEAAGTYSGVLNASGLTSGNYAINYVAGNYTVVPANQLLVRLNNLSSTYGTTPAYGVKTAQYMLSDGTVVNVNSAVTGSHVNVNDGVGGNVGFDIAVTGAAYSSSNHLNVNSYQLGGEHVTGSSASFSNNLTVVGAHTVTPLAISVAHSGVSKTYDGTTSMTGLTLNPSGQLGGDVVAANASGTFDSKNAGTSVGYTIRNLGLSGADAANYMLTNGPSGYSANDGVINKAALTLTATANTKTYDATTAAAAAPTVSGLQGADTVTGLTESYADKNAGTGKTLSVNTGYVINDGNGGNNYTVSTVGNSTGVITARPITVTAPGNVTKTFDGNTSVPSPYMPVVSGGVGEGIQSASLTYATPDSGTGKTVNVSNVIMNDGNGGNNYIVTVAADHTGIIHPAAGPVVNDGRPVPAEIVSTVLRNMPSSTADIALEVPISLEGRLQADAFIQLTEVLQQIPEITTITSVAETGSTALPTGVSYDAKSGRLQYEKLADIPLHLTATGLDRNNRLRHIKLKLKFRPI
jgi:hypothetical protein